MFKRDFQCLSFTVAVFVRLDLPSGEAPSRDDAEVCRGQLKDAFAGSRVYVRMPIE